MRGRANGRDPRAPVRIAALDPAAPYRAALVDPEVGPLNAQLVLDHVHVAKWANAAIDARRRVQQETLGHRGRKGDPLYGIRRLLLCAHDRLIDTAIGCIEVGLGLGDPYEEAGCVHYGKELLRHVHAAWDITARRELERFFDWAAKVDVPERSRLARSIDWWRAEVLAYFRTGGASSGPVEAVNGELEQIDRWPAAPGHSTTTAPGCCSRPPSPGRLHPLQDSACRRRWLPGGRR